MSKKRFFCLSAWSAWTASNMSVVHGNRVSNISHAIRRDRDRPASRKGREPRKEFTSFAAEFFGPEREPAEYSQRISRRERKFRYLLSERSVSITSRVHSYMFDTIFLSRVLFPKKKKKRVKFWNDTIYVVHVERCCAPPWRIAPEKTGDSPKPSNPF